MSKLDGYVAEVTQAENKIYELIDKGDKESLREANILIHDLAETLRVIIKDTDDLASRPVGHSRVNISGDNGPFQIGNGCVQTNQF